jgi:hypothetical protein
MTLTLVSRRQLLSFSLLNLRILAAVARLPAKNYLERIRKEIENKGYLISSEVRLTLIVTKYRYQDFSPGLLSRICSS